MFGFLFLKSTGFLPRLIFFFLWFLFIPNTIYLVTDAQYFPNQFLQLDFFNRILLIVQYLLVVAVGVVTFLVGLLPLEKLLSYLKVKDKLIKNAAIAVMSYLIAFAVALGKIQRVSSWHVVTDPKFTISGSLATFYSSEMMNFVLLFGTFSSILYFTCRKFFPARLY